MSDLLKLSATLRDGLRMIKCRRASNLDLVCIIGADGFVEFNSFTISQSERKQIDLIADNFALFYNNIKKGDV